MGWHHSPWSELKLLLPSYTQESRRCEEKVGKEKKREEGARGREGEAGRGNEGCQNEEKHNAGWIWAVKDQAESLRSYSRVNPREEESSPRS